MSVATEERHSFFKLSGAGNDFVALAEPRHDPTPAEIAGWCRRGLSLGADGVFVLRRIATEGETPCVAMTHYNADGGLAELCFNGARCAARLAFHLRWAEDEVDVATGAGTFRAGPSSLPRSVAIEAPVPVARPKRVTLRLEAPGAETVEGWHLVVGVPHLVVPVDGTLAGLDIARLGPPLRRHPDLGPQGANVNFASFSKGGAMALRTWERGVEGETLACGSGIIASARVGVMLGAVALPLEVLSASGRPLRLDGAVEDGVPVAWRLEGDARVVAEGRLGPEAL